MNKKFKRHKGFTLAEVLITLGIIGVVAAITIPNLTNDSNNQETASKVKKIYSTLAQATNKLQSSYNLDLTDSNTLAASYKSVLSSNATSANMSLFAPNKYKYYKGGDYGVINAWGSPTIALSDGTLVAFLLQDSSCSLTYGSGVLFASSVCGYFHVDTNGKKAPNMFGKDFIQFWLIKTNGEYRVLPYGTSGDGQTCVANSVAWATSTGCVSYYIKGVQLP